jgi:hypothetical protein
MGVGTADARHSMTPFIRTRRSLKHGLSWDLQKLHGYAVKVAEAAFEKKGKSPFLWIMYYRGRLIVWDTPWENDAEKHAHSRMMRFYMLMLGVEAYSFITEAWISAPSKEVTDALIAKWGDDYRAHMPMPKDDPNREDVLLVSTFDKRVGDHLMTRYGVRYNSKRPGFGRLLARDDWGGNREGQHMEGRMWNLLADPTPDEIRMLQRMANLARKDFGDDYFDAQVRAHPESAFNRAAEQQPPAAEQPSAEPWGSKWDKPDPPVKPDVLAAFIARRGAGGQP